jgi:murein hydrolase activator
MLFYKYYSLILLMIFSWSTTLAQSKDNLEKERKKINQEIEKTDKSLKQALKNKQNTLNTKNTIDSKVNSKKKTITDITYEINKSDNRIKSNNKMIDSLNVQIYNLKKQYLQLQRFSYLRSLSNNKWVYLLSSQNINILFLRWRYLNQFDQFTKNKKQEFVALQDQLKDSNEFMRSAKDEKGKQLVIEQKTAEELKKELEQSEKTLQALSKEEEDLKKELERKKIVRGKLNDAIENIIFSQLKESKEKTAARKVSGSDKDKALNTKEVELAENFSQNKKRFSWPISSGHIASRFGAQPHPSLKGVTIENNGIDIKSKGGREVKAIFEGEVAGVTKVPGANLMVIIRHGNYYTVYSNLAKVSVNKGSKVGTQQNIGTIANDENGISTIHFEIWKDKNNLNPEGWLQ